MAETSVVALTPSQRVDFECAAYKLMVPDWERCEDIKRTDTIREKRGQYLPKFESEDTKDYDARVKMTFVHNHYSQALEDQVGLVMAQEMELGSDVSEAIQALLENVNGEGDHWTVFAQNALLTTLDDGHAILVTDYPVVEDKMSPKDVRDLVIRPYWCLYSGKNAISWRTVVVGGRLVLTQLVLREHAIEGAERFGEKEVTYYRVFSHDVVYDAKNRPIGLGDVHWELFESRIEASTLNAPMSIGSGVLLNSKNEPLSRIPIRIIYDGRKTGFLTSKPFFAELAETIIQETQVESDYGCVMHKCNVPTPVFKGRDAVQRGQPITMGQGIDVPVDGDAKMLEPTGAALEATRNRLTDIRAQIQRQGGFVRETGQQMSATEAAIYARQRNARLIRATRSLKDALEGGIMDMQMFDPKLGEEGGSITVSMDFGMAFDPIFVGLCLTAYEKGALPLEATMYALKTGKLPEDFNPEDAALRMMVDQQKEMAMQAKMKADAAASTGDPAASDTAGASYTTENP